MSNKRRAGEKRRRGLGTAGPVMGLLALSGEILQVGFRVEIEWERQRTCRDVQFKAL